MELTFQFEWEVRLIEALQSLIRTVPLLEEIFSLITIFGEPVMAVVVVGLLYWCIDKKTGVRVGICTLPAMTTNCMIKNIFRRIRPYAVNESIHCIRVPEPRYDINDMIRQGYSFPSGHATVSSALLTSFYLIKKNRKLLTYGSVLVVLISLSRVALGVHYPTDVLTGIILGAVPVLIVNTLMDKLNKKQLYLILVLYSCIGVFFCKSDDYYSVLGLLIGFVCGDIFDERYVNFENTRNITRTLIRTLAGGLFFLCITTLLKLPFSKEVLNAQTQFAYLYRVFRYGVGTFGAIGLYPILFRYNILKFKE
ncbi:MAG: phosphatase PAP2 family protein [Erysipelotrichaceae bacterium]|nr:phosphatase PAP2 family protein [Erysipelotrichaceae bacterium]